jgi:23S rRNA pseudouridine1911/1915/1917 synthase
MNTPQVIFEDDYILALNKPTGYVVNDSNTISDAPSLQDYIDKTLSFELSHNKEFRNGIVHRLDKPTSGVILVAKTEKVFNALQKEFADREVNKVYVALVHGNLLDKSGEINAKIGRLPWKRTKFGVLEEGRDALTKYKLIDSNNNYSLIELYPKTGRTHQLRVHMKHINHPIVGDLLYGGRKVAKADIKNFGRLMLHAKSIEFTHPITKEEIKLEAPLPQNFNLP